jgi:hypothetical protein
MESAFLVSFLVGQGGLQVFRLRGGRLVNSFYCVEACLTAVVSAL